MRSNRPLEGDRVRDRIRERLTYANVMATLAVFIALGGSSYAAATISGSTIKNRSISGSKLKHNTLTGTQIKESKLARVPRARDADRVGGQTAADLKIRCPAETFPIADVCVERTTRAAGSWQRGARRAPASGRRRARSAASDARRVDAALTAVPLAPGGELTSNVYPSNTDPGRLDVALHHRPGGQSVALTPDTAAGAKAFRCVTDPLN